MKKNLPKLEKNKPLVSKYESHKLVKFLKSTKIGDSFFIKGSKLDYGYTSIMNAAFFTGTKIASRKVFEKNKEGRRYWITDKIN